MLSSAVKHILRIAAMFLILAFLYFVWKCPMRFIFGVPCPGCGMTRAAMSILRLDFKSAFYCHPLVFLMPPVFLYIVHIRVLPQRLGKKTEFIIAAVIVLLFIAVYIYRFYTGSEIVAPHFNKSLIYYLIQGGK